MPGDKRHFPSLTASQHSLVLPTGVREEVGDWIQTQPVGEHRDPLQAPFPRVIDFWFMSVCWAVGRSLTPVDQCSGGKFVTIGPNAQDVKKVPEAWGQLLCILGVRDFGVEDDRSREAKELVDLANRYAEVGAPKLLSVLKEREQFETPRLYQMVEFLEEVMEGMLDGVRRSYL